MKPSIIVYSLGSFLAAYIILLIVYTQYPIVYGIDGPYYLIQLKHLASEGVIKYPDPPLTYYLLLPFYLLSADKNLGLKTAIAFYGGLTSLLLYMSFRRIGNFSGLTAALTFVISPYTLRLANDFFKNYEILDKPPISPSQIQDLYLIVEKNKLPRGIPPKAKLIFDGRNIMIIKLG